MSNKKMVKSFTINGNQEMIFDIVKNYLPVLKFTIQTSQKPVLIVAIRGSKFGKWLATTVENVPTILRISFSGSQNVTQIVCEYNLDIPCQVLPGFVQQEHYDFIDNEVEIFKNYIFTAISQQSQPIQDPKPVQMQPSVNIHIGKVGDDISTIKDSVVQHTDIGGKGNVLETKSFKICPYCGKDLNLPKTPKFCPYCGDTLS